MERHGAISTMADDVDQASWLASFHAGDREILADCYREYFATVNRAVGRVLSGADQETVVHEVFFRLLASDAMRRSYQGGSLAAWLTTVARNQAIDHVRRYRRERSLDAQTRAQADAGLADRTEARLLVERFRRDHLPGKWARVFELRFLAQKDQRTAAAEIGISRTTLAYQEHRVRQLLRRFLLREAS